MADFHHQDNKDIVSGDSIRKILVVDNDVSTAELIRDNMAPDGFIVDAVSADDNSFSINLAQYKLVFINLGEETESGLALLEQIKQLDDGKNTAVIAYSVRMGPDTIIGALSAGADDYLIKPFSVREMRVRINSVLRRH